MGIKWDNFDTLDASGRAASDRYISDIVGKEYKHENGHTYKISKLVWIGEQDLWGISAMRNGSDVEFIRPLEYFFGSPKIKTHLRP